MHEYIKFSIVAVMTLFILVSPSFAFGLSGGIYKEEVYPGQEISHKIIVYNSGNNATFKEFTADIYGFAKTINGINIEISPEQDTSSFTARPFLTIEPNSFSLEPGDTKTIFLNGTIPNDTVGGKYALATIMEKPKDIQGISYTTAIQVPILLTIKDGDILQTGNITSLETSQSNKEVAVNITLKNTGNVHYKPLAEVTLKDQTDRILAEKRTDLDKAESVLPTNSYLFNMNLVPEDGLSSGKYIVEARVILEDGTVLDSKETELVI